MRAVARARSALLVGVGLALPAACGSDGGEEARGTGGSGGAGAGIDGSIESSQWPDAGSSGTGGLPPGDASADAVTDAATEASCTPVKEVCGNGADDDCDEDEDCADPDCDFAECATDKRCKAQQCVSVFQTATVGCSTAANTGTKICQAAGWQGCADSMGYWWWQCAGPGECPTPWTGLTCTSYATGVDCVSVPLNSSQLQSAQKGCSGVYGATDFGYDCSGYNPGYTVRARCN